ncbi:MAG TPA: hypothetical protein VG165_12405 [Solirubrobacteraceae bacterium]|nr:hypothetical protein [Solirubrobacteraceae bacterium]
MRTSKRSRVVLAAASTLALAGAGAGVATATSTSTSKPAANSARPAPPAELTGTALTQASAAAIAAVPGGTVEHANAAGKMDPSGTAYDVHVTKTDGTHVVVLEDATFKVLSVKADHGPGGPGGRGGPGGPGGRGGPGGGAALTGTTLTQASAAAIAAVPGGTVEHASAAGPNAASGAAYDVLVGKTDGTRVVVLEDSTFKVLSVKTPPTPPQGAGKPPAMPANSTP